MCVWGHLLLIVLVVLVVLLELGPAGRFRHDDLVDAEDSGGGLCGVLERPELCLEVVEDAGSDHILDGVALLALVVKAKVHVALLVRCVQAGDDVLEEEEEGAPKGKKKRICEDKERERREEREKRKGKREKGRKGNEVGGLEALEGR